VHIPKPKFSDSAQLQLISELAHLIEQPSATQDPPCPRCQKPDRNNSECSYTCENAAEALSEEPNQFPIEENVVPLVFELTTLRLMQTCWSCEGHASIDGEILKLPQISFYTEKPFYAQLISKYLSRLFWRKELQYPWEIMLSDYGQTLEATYTIKCNLDHIENPVLQIMHQDLNAMSKDFSTQIKNYAQELLLQLKS